MIQTQDELQALEKACNECAAFQTKSTIFKEGWNAAKLFFNKKPSTMKTLNDSALDRDIHLVIACSYDVARARTNADLYIARERLRKVLQFLNEDPAILI